MPMNARDDVHRMYNHRWISPFPLMTCLRFIRLAFAVTLTVSAANCLMAQTTRASAMQSGAIISLTQEPPGHRGASSLDVVDAGINQGIGLDVLAVPPLSDSAVSGESEPGRAPGRGRWKTGTPYSLAASGVSAGKGPGQTGSPAALLPAQSSGFPSTAVATGRSQTHFPLSVAGQTAIGGQLPVSGAVPSGIYSTPGQVEPGPAVTSRRASSANLSENGWNTADTSGNGASTTDESVDGSSSTGDQSISPNGSSSTAADRATQKRLFEGFKDPLAGELENSFEGFNGSMGFSRTCGEACSLRSSTPSAGPRGFGAQESEQSDQDSEDRDSSLFPGSRNPLASSSTRTTLGAARSSRYRKPGLATLAAHGLPR
jgi:hypothetical protein